MASFSSIYRKMIRRALVAGCVLAVSACASERAPSSRATYRVVWTATRTSDHAALISASVAVGAGGSATVRTGAKHPTEDRPALPSFTARLSRARRSGVLELVSRADLLEAARNKKGKLKVSKRNIGSLVPIRAGETQLISLPGDPVHLEVRLERD